MNAAADLIEQLRGAARAGDIPMIEALVQPGEPPAIPQVVLDGDEAVAFLGAVRPSVLYLVAVPLSVDHLAEEARADLGLPDDVALPESVAEPLRRLAPHAGEICRVTAQFVTGGVLHSTLAWARWLDAFEDAVQTAAERMGEAAEYAHEADRSARAAQVDTLARQLVAEPAFTFGRTSAAKRLLLAEAMFPGEDRYLLSEAVDRADQLDWLVQSGFERCGA